MRMNAVGRRLTALVVALLLALPFAGGGSPASRAEAPETVLAPPVEADVAEAGEASLPDPSTQLFPLEVDAPEEASTASPEQTAVPVATEQPEVTLAPEITATPGPTLEPTPEPPKLAQRKVRLGVRETCVLAFEGGMTGRDVGARFSSSDKSVVTVGWITGKLKGRGVGTATVTAKLPGGVKRACRVTVKAAPKKVTLSPKKATLGVGETMKLTAKLPGGAWSAVTYTSSDDEIATVDASGVVTALKKGTVTITVKTANGKKDTVKIKVVE